MTFAKFLCVFTVVCFVGMGSIHAAEKFKIDTTHSTVLFSVKHLGLVNIHGQFSDFKGAIWRDKDTGDITKISGKIEAKSLFTGDEKRDAFIAGPELLDQKKKKRIHFDAMGIKKVDESHIVATGILHMHGVSSMIDIPFDVAGPYEDQNGDQRLGLRAELTLDRTVWGISYDPRVGDRELISKDVHVVLEIEAVR